jgi:hypothetical protein
MDIFIYSTASWEELIVDKKEKKNNNITWKNINVTKGRWEIIINLKMGKTWEKPFAAFNVSILFWRFLIASWLVVVSVLRSDTHEAIEKRHWENIPDILVSCCIILVCIGLLYRLYTHSGIWMSVTFTVSNEIKSQTILNKNKR